jgi:hypothetical protein
MLVSGDAKQEKFWKSCSRSKSSSQWPSLKITERIASAIFLAVRDESNSGSAARVEKIELKCLPAINAALPRAVIGKIAV